MNPASDLNSKTPPPAELIQELESRNSALQESLRKRDEEIASVNRELECLTYAISHDLRAPLRGLDGLIAAFTEDCAATLDNLGKTYLDQISMTGKQITGLIDGLLELSRVTGGPFRPRNVNLSQLTNEIAKQFEDKYSELSVERLGGFALMSSSVKSAKGRFQRKDAKTQRRKGKHEGKTHGPNRECTRIDANKGRRI